MLDGGSVMDTEPAPAPKRGRTPADTEPVVDTQMEVRAPVTGVCQTGGQESAISLQFSAPKMHCSFFRSREVCCDALVASWLGCLCRLPIIILLQPTLPRSLARTIRSFRFTSVDPKHHLMFGVLSSLPTVCL